MNRPFLAAGCGLVVPLVPSLLGAQGHLPQASPYRDLEYKQELTVVSGYFRPSKDPAGVAPREGPLLGVRYDLHLGGPAYFTARVAGVASHRTVIDPAKATVAERNLGSRSWPIALADVGFSLNLTGQKTFHRVVPVLEGGLGVASDLKRGADVGQYRFGTPFALSYGAGVKWVPGGRVQLRADIASHLYQIKYPETYYVAAASLPSVVTATQAKNFWKNNLGVTFGVSYLFFR